MRRGNAVQGKALGGDGGAVSAPSLAASAPARWGLFVVI
jgi:hypothetical protein